MVIQMNNNHLLQTKALVKEYGGEEDGTHLLREKLGQDIDYSNPDQVPFQDFIKYVVVGVFGKQFNELLIK